MSTISIVDQALSIASSQRSELITQYRKLLSLSDPKEADSQRLLEVAGLLEIPRERITQDLQVVREVNRLRKLVKSANEAEADAQNAFEASEKHRASMEKKIATLKDKQTALDADLSAAKSRASLIADGTKHLDELQAENAELFPEYLEEKARTEREQRESLANSVSEIYGELKQAQIDLEEAEAVLDKAIDNCNEIAPGSERKEEVIRTKTEALQNRDSLRVKIADLYDHLDAAENTRRNLLR